MHHAAIPFTGDRPIPVNYYANELNRYVQGIVPGATQEQIKTIEAIVKNLKASHAHCQEKLSEQNTGFKEKLSMKDGEIAALTGKLNHLEKMFEHMETEKNLYELNMTTDEQYENYISSLKKDFKQKTEEMKTERDNYKDQVAQLENKIDMLNDSRHVTAHQRPSFGTHSDPHPSVLVFVDDKEVVSRQVTITTYTTDTIASTATTTSSPFTQE